MSRVNSGVNRVQSMLKKLRGFLEIVLLDMIAKV